ncbi:hypothetical protein [Flavihumibacter profundi]|uniref:hypothetical protein n=1 Tax=Flavihumibacter profundi TaxID=2716883 RepID=UPI001CC652FA|nr:hypothetical protein [Flavihumibacter profundi]MBZ5856280.1 hypothetical protein [Flavihumibacter profundi]
MHRIILISLMIISLNAGAQTMGGSWYGKADVVLDGTFNNYLTELVIKQKGNTVEGIFGYYFRNGYQSFFVKGTYDPQTRQVSIPNIPVVFYKANSIDGVTCNMSFEGTLRISKVGSFVRGAFSSDSKYKYTCPELRVLFSQDSLVQQDSVINNGMAKKLWQPTVEDLIVIDDPKTADGPVIKNAVTSAGLSRPEIKGPSVSSNSLANLTNRFKQRQTIVANELIVASDSVRISFYDNGDIDGDSISVFLNGNPVLEKQMISAKALTIYVKLDPNREFNDVAMFAENLGRIPPNTALMVIYDGETPQEIFLTSNLTQNGSVRIRKKQPPKR